MDWVGTPERGPCSFPPGAPRWRGATTDGPTERGAASRALSRRGLLGDLPPTASAAGSGGRKDRGSVPASPEPVRLDRIRLEVSRMDSGGQTSITWYGHACVELVTPGGVTVLFDPWFANPVSPRAPDTVDRCDLHARQPRARRSHGQRDSDRQPHPAGLAGDPRADALAQQRLLRPERHHRHEQGRHGGGLRAARDHDLGRPLGRRLGQRRRGATLSR